MKVGTAGESEARLKPGTLWRATRERTRRALDAGALEPIRTRSTFLADAEVRFLVRMVSSLERKARARERPEQRKSRGFNPFLPYDEEMFVADISPTHLCLLNKYNVIHHHLLIVTRAFEDQRALLTLPDFEAACACLAQFDALAFYNGGRVAGASQRHKHLQMIPLPMAPSGARLPIDPLIEKAPRAKGLFVLPQFPFTHAVARLDGLAPVDSPELPRHLLRLYRRMLRATGLNHRFGSSAPARQAGPYNLLFTRQWMLLVPRSREFFRGISVNALGFAGALLVKDKAQLLTLRNVGPMVALSRTSVKLPAGKRRRGYLP